MFYVYSTTPLSVYSYRIGRLLYEMSKIDSEVTCLKDIIFRYIYEALEKAVDVLMHVSSTPAPSSGIKLGIALPKIANLLKADSIMKRNTILVKECENFLQLIQVYIFTLSLSFYL